MKRDKLISIRVNSKLLNQLNLIIEENTRCFETRATKRYYSEKFTEYFNCYHFCRKLSIADILERSMKEFINKYK